MPGPTDDQSPANALIVGVPPECVCALFRRFIPVAKGRISGIADSLEMGDMGVSFESWGDRTAGGDCKKDGTKRDCNDRRSFISTSRIDSFRYDADNSACISRGLGLVLTKFDCVGDEDGVVASECERVEASCDEESKSLCVKVEDDDSNCDLG